MLRDTLMISEILNTNTLPSVNLSDILSLGTHSIIDPLTMDPFFK